MIAAFIFVGLWAVLMGLIIAVAAEQAADRRKEQAFMRRLRFESERLARYYGV